MLNISFIKTFYLFLFLLKKKKLIKKKEIFINLVNCNEGEIFFFATGIERRKIKWCEIFVNLTREKKENILHVFYIQYFPLNIRRENLKDFPRKERLCKRFVSSSWQYCNRSYKIVLISWKLSSSFREKKPEDFSGKKFFSLLRSIFTSCIII